MDGRSTAISANFTRLKKQSNCASEAAMFVRAWFKKPVQNLQKISGDYNEEDTPVPIPNTEVKLFSADDTWWVTAWESRTSPGTLIIPR